MASTISWPALQADDVLIRLRLCRDANVLNKRIYERQRGLMNVYCRTAQCEDFILATVIVAVGQAVAKLWCRSESTYSYTQLRTAANVIGLRSVGLRGSPPEGGGDGRKRVKAVLQPPAALSDI